MSCKRIVVAGTGSGVGKTTVAIGLMAAYKEMGYTVQGFKCGPDYLDPTYHTAVTKRPSRNLDSWMCEPSVVKEIFIRGCHGANIAVIEGVMGLFDGKEPTTNKGSAAEIAMLTGSSVLLVVDCSGMARSAAAVVKGFQTLSPGLHLCGVVANRVGSYGHYELIREAVEKECGIPVIGYLTTEEELQLPERHLGLIPTIERGDLAPFFRTLAETIRKSFNLELLYELMESSEIEVENRLFSHRKEKRKVKIAVAKDSAFHFYYPENLELLEQFGAEIQFFSPLKGEVVPNDAHGLYIGGGFPEEFANLLSEQKNVLQSVKQAIENGMPTLAECGGYMFLSESIETTNGVAYPMVGVIPGKVTMQRKLASLGYRELTGLTGNFLIAENERVRGHEFHYSTHKMKKDVPPAYVVQSRNGVKQEGVVLNQLVAGYTHLHFASEPMLAKRWIEASKRYKEMDIY